MFTVFESSCSPLFLQHPQKPRIEFITFCILGEMQFHSQTIFAMEVKNSLLNYLIHFYYTCQNVGGPIRQHCISDTYVCSFLVPLIPMCYITYGTKKSCAVCRRLGLAGLKPEHEKAVRSFMNSQDVFESLTSGKFECQ